VGKATLHKREETCFKLPQAGMQEAEERTWCHRNSPGSVSRIKPVKSVPASGRFLISGRKHLQSPDSSPELFQP
jgi:hypothetical protein